jgi:hypothetical protein
MMALYNFKKRFVPMILSGEKTHTIRAKRARSTQPGEMLHLYTGLRQKGAQLLMRTVCTMIQDIRMELDGGTVLYSSSLESHIICPRLIVDGNALAADECQRLAIADGFVDFPTMMAFWEGRFPFTGDIIHWSFPPTPHTHSGDAPCANARSRAVRTSSKTKTFSVLKSVAAPTTTKNAANCAKQSVQAENRVRSAD